MTGRIGDLIAATLTLVVLYNLIRLAGEQRAGGLVGAVLGGVSRVADPNKALIPWPPGYSPAAATSGPAIVPLAPAPAEPPATVTA